MLLGVALGALVGSKVVSDSNLLLGVALGALVGSKLGVQQVRGPQQVGAGAGQAQVRRPRSRGVGRSAWAGTARTVKP